MIFKYVSTKKLEENIQVVHFNKHQETEFEFDYYIGRPGILGNPYTHLTTSTHSKYVVKTRDDAIDSYEDYFYDKLKTDIKFKSEVNKLIDIYKNHQKLNLICWCKPKRCHGDFLKEYLIDYLKNLT